MAKIFFSKDGKYRYFIIKTWDKSKPRIMFIMLNPSTKHDLDSPNALSKCIEYAKIWDYGSICIVNIFAFRSNTPTGLYSERDPIGPENDKFIKIFAKHVDMILLGWGNHGIYKNRGKEILKLLKPFENKLYCLDLNKSGEPRHPLYLSESLIPRKYELENKLHVKSKFSKLLKKEKL